VDDLIGLKREARDHVSKVMWTMKRRVRWIRSMSCWKMLMRKKGILKLLPRLKIRMRRRRTVSSVLVNRATRASLQSPSRSTISCTHTGRYSVSFRKECDPVPIEPSPRLHCQKSVKFDEDESFHTQQIADSFAKLSEESLHSSTPDAE